MVYQIFLSPQVKRIVIITNKHGIYELPHEMSNGTFAAGRAYMPTQEKKKKTYDLRKLGNVKKIPNLHRIIA